jgi:hypothetical protein
MYQTEEVLNLLYSTSREEYGVLDSIGLQRPEREGEEEIFTSFIEANGEWRKSHFTGITAGGP